MGTLNFIVTHGLEISYTIEPSIYKDDLWLPQNELLCMRVISRKRLREFCEIHADACEPLYAWYKIAGRMDWQNLVDVQKIYPKAESVGNFTVFNIKGNRYRLIVDLVYPKRRRIYIKYVLTHAEYDKDNWKNAPYF